MRNDNIRLNNNRSEDFMLVEYKYWAEFGQNLKNFYTYGAKSQKSHVKIQKFGHVHPDSSQFSRNLSHRYGLSMFLIFRCVHASL